MTRVTPAQAVTIAALAFSSVALAPESAEARGGMSSGGGGGRSSSMNSSSSMSSGGASRSSSMSSYSAASAARSSSMSSMRGSAASQAARSGGMNNNRSQQAQSAFAGGGARPPSYSGKGNYSGGGNGGDGGRGGAKYSSFESRPPASYQPSSSSILPWVFLWGTTVSNSDDARLRVEGKPGATSCAETEGRQNDKISEPPCSSTDHATPPAPAR